MHHDSDQVTFVIWQAVGQLILEDHMQGCLVDAAKDGDFETAFRDLKKSLDQFIG